MEKWWWIIIGVIVILAVGFIALIVVKKEDTGFSIDISGLDFSSGGIGSSIADSTRGNAFDDVETNPFRYKNG